MGQCGWNMNDAIRMQISAFVDGELPDNEADLLLRRLSQDSELRQEVAEYLAIGRIMRGEASVPGVDAVHERVLAALDDRPFEDEDVAAETPQRHAIRPLVGVAIAASVALLAIFGLQQTAVEVPGDDAAVTAADSGAETYTVPQPADNQLRAYYLSHGATTTENGANGMKARLVNVLLQEPVEEMPAEEQDKDESDNPPAQP